MGRRKISIKQSAADSISAIAWFIESKGLVTTAEKYIDAIYDFIDKLGDTRKSYPVCREPGRAAIGYKCIPYKKKYTCIALSILFCLPLSAQTNLNFVVNGKINADTGLMVLLPAGNKSYYEMVDFNHEIIVKDGKFTITGRTAYPTALKLLLKQNGVLIYLSGLFFIEPGTQSMTCNIDSLRETPEIDNKTMREYRIFTSQESLISDKQLRNDFTIAYTRSHPDSYVTLWNLADNSFSYSPVMDSIYYNFSPRLKQNYTTKKLAETITILRNTAVERKMPSLFVLNDKNNKYKIDVKQSTAKYTLIDFWFSKCTPCISQFSELAELYKQYHSKGFEILGVSVDGRDKEQDWREVIVQHKLPWPQYLDLAGKEAKKLRVLVYPTNYLLNEEGIIVAKDLDPKALKNWLSLNLNK